MAKKVAVRMKQLSAGPDGVFKPGQVVIISADKAEQLIAGNYAEPVTSAPETAAVEAPEKAVQPKPQRKQPAPPEPSGPESELAELVGDNPARALVDAGVNSIEAALEALGAGADLTEIKGVGAGTVEKLSALLPEASEEADAAGGKGDPSEADPDEGSEGDGETDEEGSEAESSEA